MNIKKRTLFKSYVYMICAAAIVIDAVEAAGKKTSADIAWASSGDRALVNGGQVVTVTGSPLEIRNPATPFQQRIRLEEGATLEMEGIIDLNPAAHIDMREAAVRCVPGAIITNRGCIVMEAKDEDGALDEERIGSLPPTSGSIILQDFTSTQDYGEGWGFLEEPLAYSVDNALTLMCTTLFSELYEASSGMRSIYAYDQIFSGDPDSDDMKAMRIRWATENAGLYPGIDNPDGDWFIAHTAVKAMMFDIAAQDDSNPSEVVASDLGDGVYMTARLTKAEIWKRPKPGNETATEYQVRAVGGASGPTVRFANNMIISRALKFSLDELQEAAPAGLPGAGMYKLTLGDGTYDIQPNLSLQIPILKTVNETQLALHEAIQSSTTEELAEQTLREFGVTVDQITVSTYEDKAIDTLEMAESNDLIRITDASGVDGGIKAYGEHTIKGALSNQSGYNVIFTKEEDTTPAIILEGNNMYLTESTWRCPVTLGETNTAPMGAVFDEELIVGRTNRQVYVKINPGAEMMVTSDLTIRMEAKLEVSGTLIFQDPHPPEAPSVE
ncbi:MAG: hypothetical protein LBJ42_02060 [Holosporales bacterium]|jgi:hypothetical protein|nr:hypothetical protein [Holosporales bacterium]